MRELRVGQVWCLDGSKRFEVTVIFLTKENVLVADLDGEETLLAKDTFKNEHTFLRNITL